MLHLTSSKSSVPTHRILFVSPFTCFFEKNPLLEVLFHLLQYLERLQSIESILNQYWINIESILNQYWINQISCFYLFRLFFHVCPEASATWPMHPRVPRPSLQPATWCRCVSWRHGAS
jgi:hypothetical protein